MNDEKIIIISVIMPSHNGEKFIGEGIESVIRQTYRHWELIIVNDRSTDSTETIVKRYAQLDKRIKICSTSDLRYGGVSAARNLGLKLCSGDYAAFLDCDDLWYENKLEVVVSSIKRNENDILFHRMKTRSDVVDALKYEEKVIGSYYPRANSYKTIGGQGYRACMSSIVVRTEILKNIGGFEESMPFAEDTLMMFEASTIGRVLFIDETLGEYRYHQAQWNSRATKRMLAKRRYFMYEKALQRGIVKDRMFVYREMARTGLGNVFTYAIVSNDYKIAKLYIKKYLKERKYSIACYIDITVTIVVSLARSVRRKVK